MRIVVGVDAGGTTTRALAVSLDGEPVGYAEAGGSNPEHTALGVQNVREAILGAVREDGVANVVRVVAGIAGYDRPDQAAWAESTTAVTGLRAARTHVNDAEIAHHAAFAGGPGVVSIQGTGSTILAVLEDGRRVRNGDLLHYAASGAVRVGIRAVQLLLRDPKASHDAVLLDAALGVWDVDSISALREAVAGQGALEPVERSRRYGAVARAVMASAEADGFFSQAVCGAAARDIADGVRLLGPLFTAEEVPFALFGACGRSPAIRDGVVRRLASDRTKRYRVVEFPLPPVVGAVRMALMSEDVALEEGVFQRLAASLEPRL